MVENLETPQFEGPLRNPDVSEEADRELDKAMDRLPPVAARQEIPEFAAMEPKNVFDEHAQPNTDLPASAKPARRASTKKPINRPSRNYRIYDRDKTVESIYGKPGEPQ